MQRERVPGNVICVCANKFYEQKLKMWPSLPNQILFHISNSKMLNMQCMATHTAHLHSELVVKMDKEIACNEIYVRCTHFTFILPSHKFLNRNASAVEIRWITRNTCAQQYTIGQLLSHYVQCAFRHHHYYNDARFNERICTHIHEIWIMCDRSELYAKHKSANLGRKQRGDK